MKGSILDAQIQGAEMCDSDVLKHNMCAMTEMDPERMVEILIDAG